MCRAHPFACFVDFALLKCLHRASQSPPSLVFASAPSRFLFSSTSLPFAVQLPHTFQKQTNKQILLSILSGVIFNFVIGREGMCAFILMHFSGLWERVQVDNLFYSINGVPQCTGNIICLFVCLFLNVLTAHLMPR